LPPTYYPLALIKIEDILYVPGMNCLSISPNHFFEFVSAG
jgi:hypothetical protein